MAQAGVDIQRITAIDLDRKASENVAAGTLLRGEDFIAWSTQTSQSFDRIVANPPFASIKSLSASLKSTALTVLDSDGDSISGTSNYWYAFLLRSIELLRPQGSLAFVLPAAWEYADYARMLRDSLHRLFARVEVHRSQEPLFLKVRDGSVVLLAHNKSVGQGQSLRLHYATRKRLTSGVNRRLLEMGNPVVSPPLIDLTEGRRLGDVFALEIGGVTGDAHYFLLSEQRRQKLQLPLSAVVPVVSRAFHLSSAEIAREDWKRLRDSGERVWLFRPRIGSGSKGSVRKYMLLSPKKGGCKKTAYKVRRRDPWYRTVLPTNVDGFVSGMSMSTPWIAWKRMRALSATNTLYVVRCRSTKIRKQRYAWALGMLTTYVQKQLSHRVRLYADGLRKFELSDLAEIRLPIPRARIGAQITYHLCVQLINDNKDDEARSRADAWFFAVAGQSTYHGARAQVVRKAPEGERRRRA